MEDEENIYRHDLFSNFLICKFVSLSCSKDCSVTRGMVNRLFNHERYGEQIVQPREAW